MKNWQEITLLVMLLIGAFAVRLYRFGSPIADWHSWRQADTSAVSRNFVQHGFDLLHPQIDNISNVQTSGAHENPKGYFFAEFPIYNAAQAGLYMLFGHFTLEKWGRLVTIFSSLISMVLLFLLGKRFYSKTVGFFAMFFYGFLPFSIYYSRTILPQSSMAAALLGGIYCFDIFLASQEKTRQYIFGLLAATFFATALLMSPYAIFYSTVFFYLLWKKQNMSFFRKWQPYVFVMITVIPFLLWRVWMIQYPEGIPSNTWLLNGGNIRFSGAFFYWIFADRIGRLILGYWGTGLLLLGMIARNKNWGFAMSLLIGSLLFITVFARGNVQHDYYQYIIMPCVSMILALGAAMLISPPPAYFHIWASRTVLLLVIFASIAFSWYFVRDYFNINDPLIVRVGKVADAILPKNARVLTFYNGDSTFLYQINRKGWASLEHSITDMVSLGADYLIILNPTKNDLQGFGKMYRQVAYSQEYLILDLHHSP